EDATWEVERRFGLQPGSLKGRATLESHWSMGERVSEPNVNMHRTDGQTNNTIVWFEIFSKTGVGARLSGMHQAVKNHLEDTVGDYAYLAVSASVPWPLNMPQERLYSETSAAVKEAFQWPVPLWTGSSWPISVLDFYPNTDENDSARAWPIPPLSPALGELKFLNFLIPWLCNRIYNTTRDFWLVAGPYRDHYLKHLQEGTDLTVIGTPLQVEDVRKAVQMLQHAETREDAWRIVELVMDLFDKRTGLTDFAYGRNEGGTQNRTAEETLWKKEAVGVRPEHMQKQVVGWQSDVATKEAFVTRWFVKAKDVAPLLGQGGAYLWTRYIESTEVERVVQQMSYTIAASSIRRPNRDRDLANFTQAMQQWLPVYQDYVMKTGNYEPMNALMSVWGELHDMDMSKLLIPPPQPDPQMEAMQQQQMQLEMAKLQTDVQKAQAVLQKAQFDIQAKQAQAQLQQQVGQFNLMSAQRQHEMQLQAQQAKSQMDLMARMKQTEMDLAAARAKMIVDSQSSKMKMVSDSMMAGQNRRQDGLQHVLDMLQDDQKFRQELTQAKEMGKLKLELARKQAMQRPKPSNQAA
ncbi:MAG: hypothetical protein KDD44_08090, partial [Bdellovibrionales bacterium]|nr:hypothetical protein [Bdellovibrionales bacterium]